MRAFLCRCCGKNLGQYGLREIQKDRRPLAARTHLLARDKSGYAASPAARWMKWLVFIQQPMPAPAPTRIALPV
jgi:hypothetical protein